MELEKVKNQKQFKSRKSIQLTSSLLKAFTQPTKTEKTSSKKSIKRRKSIQGIPPKGLGLNQNNHDKKNIKRRSSINNTSSLDKLHYNQKNQRRQSYSELFMLKLNYVSNDIGLSQKSEGAYSNFYKDGKRVFDDLEKSNSLKNSFALSNSKTDLKEIKYRRRASLQPNCNLNFDFLSFGDYKKKNRDNESRSDSSNSSDSNNSSFDSSHINSSEDIETKAKKKMELIEKEKELKNSKKRIPIINNEKNRKNLLNNGIILEDPNENKEHGAANDDDEIDEEKDYNNVISDNLKKIFNIRDSLKEQLEKINNLDEEMKKQILKRYNSLENINNKYNKDFILHKKDLEPFFKRSKSLNTLMKDYNKKYNMNNIEEIISKNLNEKNSKKLNLDGELIEGKINQTNDETLNIKTNFNSPNEQNLIKSKSGIKTLGNDNHSPSGLKDLNSSEIKKKNIESFLTRGGKISFLEFDEIDKKAVDKFKKKQEEIKTTTKKEEEDTNTVIDNLLNRIKEKNKEKINILSTFKEENEKKLIELKQKKNELEEKKLQLNKEKKEKEEIKHMRMNGNKMSNLKSHYKTLSIELTTSLDNYKNNNDTLKNQNYYENSLNLLSQPIITKKEKKFNLRNTIKHEFLNSNINLDNNNIDDELNNNIIKNNNYDFFKNLNMSNRNSLLDQKTYTDGKESLRSSYNLSQAQKGKKYLRLLKRDMNDFYKKANGKKHSNVITLTTRKNIKDYIMPVNDLDDVIQINNIYMNLSPNFNINKKD